MSDLLIDATEKTTYELLQGLEHGDEKKLNSDYTLYRYLEDDVVVIVRTQEWEEELQVMWDEDENIIFEQL